MAGQARSARRAQRRRDRSGPAGWPRRRWSALTIGLLLVLTLLLAWLAPLARAQGAAPAPAAAPNPRLGEEIRAVWFTSNDMDVLRDRHRMREAVRQLAALHFNTIYPVVYNSGLVYYPSAVSEREGLQTFQYRGLEGQDILADLIAEGHRQGMLVLPWFEFGFMVPPGSVLTRRHPDWLSRRRDGSVTSISAAGEVSWLNPLHPEVQSLLRDLILEIATSYDADGIQFDDHTSLPHDFGYDSYTRALYQRSSKREPPANASDGAWLKWRADGISAFMDKLHTELQQRRPGFVVSLSPNYHDFAYKRQLQDWLTWLRQGSIDELVVQLYRPDLASFEAELNRPEFSFSRQRVPTAIGILTGQRTAPVPIERVVAQAQAARQRGLGAALFYYETLWEEPGSDESPQQRRGALASLFRAPAPRRPRGAAAQIAAPQPGLPPTSPPASAARTPAPMPAAKQPAPSLPPPLPAAVEALKPPTADPAMADPAAADPAMVDPAMADPAIVDAPVVDPSFGPYNGAILEPIPPP